MATVADELEGRAPRRLEFDSFFREVYPRLAQALLLITGSTHEAQDVAQEAMVRVYERWDRVRQMDSPTGYVYRAALNLHRSRARRLAVAARRRLRGGPQADPLEWTETWADVAVAVRALPRAQREALVLVDVVDLPTEDVADILGIAPASVRGRVHRARQTLRQRLEAP